jgi:hypothetical protein
VGILKERNHLKDLDVNGRIIIRMNRQEIGLRGLGLD